MTSFASVSDLDAFLATRSYVTGFSFSEDDKTAFSKLSAAPSPATHPHAYRWAIHIAALSGTSISFLGAPSAAAAAVPTSAAKPAAAAAADDLNLFGEDDDDDGDETAEEKAATKARQERMALARKLKEDKDAKDGKKKDKVKAVEKSLVVLEVKPWEADTDLKMVWEKIKEYQQEGLSWGEAYKLEPVAYGIMKLVMTATIVDSLVLMDDITENIEAIEEYVQSVTVASMNKIS